MAKINVLPSEIFNLIAAGEVVERPASVVKELVENAIDANATEISINIQDGGIKKIRVVDNGCGIEKSEMHKVLLPHATSKIKTKDDLGKIGTLGFRGEALASISAVAKITITSRTKNQELATTLENDANQSIYESGASCGTMVEVMDLFSNVPARAKFLKKPKSEEAEVSNLILRYILAHPNISFKYTADGKTIYSSTGNGLEEAMFAVYGKEATERTIKVDRTFGEAHIYGYIGKPTFSKPNRTYQTLVLNGRYIQNLSVQTAVTNGYGDFLMKRQYPFYVLFLDMPLEEVDVNVHPNKMEVRFSSGINVYPWFFETVVRALHQNDYNPETLSTKQDAEVSRPTINVNFKADHNDSVYISDMKVEKIDNYFESANKLFDNNKVASGPSVFNNQFKQVDNHIINTTSGEVIESAAQNGKTCVVTPQKPQQQISFAFAPEYRIVGKLFNTYLVIEQGNEVLFIDQHAMHERILFDRLKAQIDNNSVAVQPMLIPHIFSTNSLETVFLEEHLQDFAALGFEIEQFGENSFKISAIPAVCCDISLVGFMAAVLSDIKEITMGGASELIRDRLATKACKAAVKGGDDLTKSEIDKLLETMQTENTPLRCPHGRPAVVKVSKNEIEKWFKRIV